MEKEESYLMNSSSSIRGVLGNSLTLATPQAHVIQGPMTVNVYCRIRPPTVPEKINWLRVRNETTIELNVPAKTPQAAHANPLRDYEFSFKRVFSVEAQQDDVYNIVAKPLVKNLLMGENGLLLSYGITGSGKTYTMTGDRHSYGIMQRALVEIFETIGSYQTKRCLLKVDGLNGFELRSERDAEMERHRELKRRHSLKAYQWEKVDANPELYAVFINYTEIYNNCVYDLLETGSLQKSLQSRLIREDIQRNQMYVHGVTEMEVKSFDEALEVFQLGQKRKRMAHTLLNAESSRSHSAFNIRLVRLLEHGGKANILVSQLSLVDLAGSERCSRTKTSGLRLKEAAKINNSLLTLRTCLEYLRANQQKTAKDTVKKIPYRDTKITHMFKHFLEGEGMVSMIVCINPRFMDYGENMQVLKFAEMTKVLQIIPKTPRDIKVIQTTTTTMCSMSVNKKLHSKVPLILNELVKSKFPPYDRQSPQATVMLKTLIAYVQQRMLKYKMIRKELDTNLNLLQQGIIQLEYENGQLRKDLKDTKSALAESETLNQILTKKLVIANTHNKELSRNLMRLQREKEISRIEMNKENECLQKQLQKETIHKEKLRTRFALISNAQSLQLDAKLKDQQTKHQQEIHFKDETLRLVTSILEADEF